MDEQRALLDQLMGMNRDGDKPNEVIHDFRNPKVCKKYLCGLCPHDLFQNTKMDMGDCEKLHLPDVKLKYEEERKFKDYGYEKELERELLRYLSDLEKKVQRANRRLEEQDKNNDVTKVLPQSGDGENNKEILQLTAEIQETLQKAEDAGNEGEVDLSMELMEKAEQLKAKKVSLQASALLANPKIHDPFAPEALAESTNDTPLTSNPLVNSNVNQKLRVCDVCGSFLSIFDSDRRLADHFGGKLHLGYLQIQKKVEEIQALLAQDKEKEKSVKTDDRRGDRSRDRDSRRRSRSRSRERRRSRDRDRRGRSRSKDRDRDRHHRRR